MTGFGQNKWGEFSFRFENEDDTHALMVCTVVTWVRVEMEVEPAQDAAELVAAQLGAMVL